ncbi:MAG: ABC transporter ATP-binding protein [Chitinophagaceae bacterium]
MLTLIRIKKYFHPGSPHEVLALDELNVTFPKGEFVVLVGANGSGKSTLLNLIAGSYFPDSGQIILDQEEITPLRDYQRSRWISRVFQDPMAGTAPDLTIRDNFRLAALRTQSKTLFHRVPGNFNALVKERLASLHMGLENKLDTLVGKLSGGQRQALTLLMAVMDEAKILLLDEPTAALDPKSSMLIMEVADQVIREFNLTAILVTHDMRYAQKFGSRLIKLENGRIEKDLQGDQKKQLAVSSLMSWFM